MYICSKLKLNLFLPDECPLLFVYVTDQQHVGSNSVSRVKLNYMRLREMLRPCNLWKCHLSKGHSPSCRVLAVVVLATKPTTDRVCPGAPRLLTLTLLFLLLTPCVWSAVTVSYFTEENFDLSLAQQMITTLAWSSIQENRFDKR